MNDRELDEILDSWKTPAAPVSLRARVRADFPRAPRPRPMRWMLGFAVAATLLALPTSLIEDNVGLGDGFQWDPHTFVVRVRMMHPQSARQQWDISGAGTTGARWVGGKLQGSVFMFSKQRNENCGYTWSTEPDGNGKYVFTVLPLDPAVLRVQAPIARIQHMPPPRVVTAGSSFDVDLYNSADGRVYDHYEIASHHLEIPTQESMAQAHATLTLTEPNVYVNGYLIPGRDALKVGGPIVSVAIPSYGYFAVALDPGLDPRFIKAGTVKGNILEFAAGANLFRVESSAAIADGGERPIFAIAQPDGRVTSVNFAGGFLPAMQGKQ